MIRTSVFPRPNHSGFTLVELALVVAIIGILTVAVLKGQNMVFDARVASAISIANDLTAASRSFKDRFHYLPGDLPNPDNYIPNLPQPCKDLKPQLSATIGDGQINLPTESQCALEELVQLGMMKADPDPINPPFHMIQNPFTTGPVRIVAANASGAYTPAWPATTANIVEFQNLPCEAVLAIDSKIDDGVLNSGKVMANVSTCPIGTGVTVGFFGISLN